MRNIMVNNNVSIRASFKKKKKKKIRGMRCCENLKPKKSY